VLTVRPDQRAAGRAGPRRGSAAGRHGASGGAQPRNRPATARSDRPAHGAVRQTHLRGYSRPMTRSIKTRPVTSPTSPSDEAARDRPEPPQLLLFRARTWGVRQAWRSAVTKPRHTRTPRPATPPTTVGCYQITREPAARPGLQRPKVTSATGFSAPIGNPSSGGQELVHLLPQSRGHPSVLPWASRDVRSRPGGPGSLAVRRITAPSRGLAHGLSATVEVIGGWARG
jgi:hypothetical protein